MRANRLLWPLLFMWLAGLSAPVWALDIAVVLSRPDGVYKAFMDALQAAVRPGSHDIYRLADPSAAAGDDRVRRADLVIAAGAPAAQSVLAAHTGPTLVVLIGSAHVTQLRKTYPKAEFATMVLDQPLSRQLAFVSAVLPGKSRLGVLLGPDSRERHQQITQAGERAGFRLLTAEVAREGEIISALEGIFSEAQALLALPDGTVSSPASARTILLTGYRFRRPIFAFSAAYVDAGALGAVFSTPEHIAYDVVDWLQRLPAGRLRLTGEHHPARFSIAVNRQVARALGLTVPDDRTLFEGLARLEARP